jgi:HK97 family phage portal protein
MELKDRFIRKFFGNIIKDEIEKSSKQIVYPIGGQATATEGILPDTDFDIYTQMYEQTSWVRAAVGVICKSVTARGYSFAPTKANANPTNADRLTTFFNNSNPNDTFLEIVEDVCRDLQTAGNSYCEITYDSDGVPIELWNLDPTSIRVIADEHGAIKGYVQSSRSNSGKVFFEAKEIIHFKLGTKGASLYGLSPLASLILPVTVDKYSQIYNRSFFLNGCKVRGAFIMSDASPEQIERNRDYMATRAKNADQGHTDLVLEGAVEFRQISTNQKDMDFLALREFTRSEILAVYGVPPNKVALVESGNIGSGSGEAQDKTFYDETILPLQMRIAEKITKHIINKGFQITDWSFQFNKRAIDEHAQAEIFNIYLQNGVFTPAEVRSIVAPRMPEVQKALDPKQAIANSTKAVIALENKFVEGIRNIFRAVGNAIRQKLPGAKDDSSIEVLLQLVDKDKIARTIERFSLEAARKGLEVAAQREGLDNVEQLSNSAQEKIRAASSSLADDLSRGMVDRLREELRAGISASETIPQLMRRIDGWVGSQKITIKPVMDAQGNVLREASTRVIGKDVLAEVIARTETNNFYNEGNLDALSQAGIKDVQWLLASDACPECADLAEASPGDKLGKIMPLEEAVGMLPAHPNCRCTWITVEDK